MCDVVKLSWSGGKDSTAAIILHLLMGHKVKAVCFIPMLCDNIPAIRKDHYLHLLHCAEVFEFWGCKVYFTSGRSYEYHVHRILRRGVRKGHFMGTGLGFGFCLFRDYCKIRAGLDSVDVGYFDYQDIGIASDEVNRIAQLDDNKRSILAELGFSEAEARDLVDSFGLLSPIYSRSGRDGCCFCPNVKTEEFLLWLTDYPEAESKILQIEEFCRKVTPTRSPYRDHCYFSDRIKYGYIQLSFT